MAPQLQVTGVAAGTSVPAGRRRRVTAPVLVAAGVLGVSVLLHVRDPHQSGSWGYCPWLLLTGTSCPGCGGLRAVHDLTHGDLAAAASSNLLLVGAIPLLVLGWTRWLGDRWTGATRQPDAGRAYVGIALAVAVTVAFWVARNTAGGAWLAP
jgi:hypothetical protein